MYYKKLVEDIIERNKVDKLRRVFFVSVGDIVEHFLGNDLELVAVVPNLIEDLKILLREWSLHLIDCDSEAIAALAT